jgi:hypothetical protein
MVIVFIDLSPLRILSAIRTARMKIVSRGPCKVLDRVTELIVPTAITSASATILCRFLMSRGLGGGRTAEASVQKQDTMNKEQNPSMTRIFILPDTRRRWRVLSSRATITVATENLHYDGKPFLLSNVKLVFNPEPCIKSCAMHPDCIWGLDFCPKKLLEHGTGQIMKYHNEKCKRKINGTGLGSFRTHLLPRS